MKPVAPTEHVVRPLTAADEPCLWTMLYHALYVAPGQPPFARDIVSRPEIRRYVENWGRPGDDGVMALIADQPVGAAWLRMWDGSTRGYGYVNDATPELSLSVLPNFRGAGIGTRLLSRALERAGAQHSAVSLSVTASNPAINLYARFGFTLFGCDGDSLTLVKRWT